MSLILNVFDEYREACATRIEHFLDQILPQTKHTRLQQAMRYSIFNGGKRLRPLLVYATGEALGAKSSTLDAAAASVELMHCYSLVHDDLPAMDNDDLRRGKPTCHIAFDEALAILSGDALQSLAFQILSDNQYNTVSSIQQLKMLRILAEASGFLGMVGGQALDMQTLGITPSLEALCAMHQQKTGALITASILLGAIAAGSQDPKQLLALEQYSECIGLAFQVQDDILDSVSDTYTLGKTQGKDRAQQKTTFPALLGLEGAKQYAQTLHDKAVSAVSFLNNNERLIALSQFFIERLY
jgi:geranylgeranyl pyrophosphate synthase